MSALWHFSVVGFSTASPRIYRKGGKEEGRNGGRKERKKGGKEARREGGRRKRKEERRER